MAPAAVYLAGWCLLDYVGFLFEIAPGISPWYPPHGWSLAFLLDLGLPQLNGYQVLESVKANANHEHIPVVILSSSDATPDVQRSYRLHASSYITKPVGLQGYRDLARKIEQYWFDAVTLPPC